MKQLFFSLLILTAISCSQNSGTEQKRAELDKLKKEQTGLREKIVKLEEELCTGRSRNTWKTHWLKKSLI